MKGYLAHHGIKGQRWGIRRYQNEDGTLTALGRKHVGQGSAANKVMRRNDRDVSKIEKAEQNIMSAREKNRNKIASKYNKKIQKLQADKDSYKPIKNGLKDKNGRDILTKDDVKSMTDALQKKIDDLSSKRNAKLKDFDQGTKYVSEGYKKYKDVINAHSEMKLKAFEDKSFKNSPEYKAAIKDYTNQVISEVLYGTPYTTLSYAMDYAKKNHQ